MAPIIDEGFYNPVSTWSHQTISNQTLRDGKPASCDGSATPGPGLEKFPKHSNKSTYTNSTGHTNPSSGWQWWYYPEDCIWSLYIVSEAAISNTLNQVFQNKDIGIGMRNGSLTSSIGSQHLRMLHDDFLNPVKCSSQGLFREAPQCVVTLAFQ